jgi:hypothetical protein
VLVSDILQPATTVDQAAQIADFRLSFGLMQLILFVGSIFLTPLFLRKHIRWNLTHIIVSAIGIIVCLYLVTYHSAWIWYSIPGSEIFMHPWRLYGVIYVIMIPIVSLVFQWMLERIGHHIVPVVLSMLFIAILPVYFPATGELTTSHITSLTDPMRYEEATGNFGTVAFQEYRPLAVQSTEDLYPCYSCYQDWTWHIYPQETALPDEVVVTISETNTLRSTGFLINTPDDFDFVLHQFYFPGWRAELNGTPIDIQVSDPNGLMMVNIPAGEQRLVMRYAGTETQFMGRAITTFSFLIAFTLFLYPARNNPQNSVHKRDVAQQPYAIAGLSLIVILVISATLKFYVEPHTNWFRLSSLPDTPRIIKNPMNTTFYDEMGQPMITLLGYNLNVSEIVHHGDWVYLDLYWQALTPLTDNIRVQVELVDDILGIPLLAVDKPNPGIIPSTGWQIDHYLMDRHILMITDDIPPYLTRLQVNVVTDDGERWRNETNTENLVLTQLHIQGNSICPDVDSSLVSDINFGHMISLKSLSLVHNDDDVLLTLCWNVKQKLDSDYRLFIHFYADDVFLESADRRPLEQYQAINWLRGQTLVSEYHLSPPINANFVHFGFYDPDSLQRIDLHTTLVNKNNNSIIISLP